MPNQFDAASADSTLFQALLAASARHGSQRIALEDVERQPLSFRRLILASLVLGAALREHARRSEAVGVLLPNVTGMVATLFGLNAFGRVAALLNFTAGVRNLRSAVATAQIRVIVTSRRFIDTAKLDDVIGPLDGIPLAGNKTLRIVYLEDVRRSIGSAAKLAGLARSLVPQLVHRAYALRPDQPAVILFTSGTEGAPKGVVLSNRNLVANATQIITHAGGMLSERDIVMNPLPMFHSFGLTAAALMPLLNGMKVVLYPSPLHFKQIPKLIGETGATVLFATDTFLQGYARAAEPDDLATVRYVIAGAERVKDQTRALWQRTGTVILEGYGATECAPVLACNLPDRNRFGSVGPLLPGIETRLEPVEGISEGGRLLVRGANVMMGYMLADRPGVVVPPAGGWHDTGDIVTIDDDRVVTIRGRAKRFAKIGGEMVSLAAVESMISGLWPESNHVVVALPDSRKGEQLVLVTDRIDAAREALLERARAEGFPELWLPRAILPVSAIPVLGSGKVDIPATIEMVRSAAPLL